jgi:hypothetical protein
MNIAEQELVRAISREIRDKSTASLTWYRIFAAATGVGEKTNQGGVQGGVHEAEKEKAS